MTKRTISLSNEVLGLLLQAFFEDFHYKKILSYCFPSTSIVLFTTFYSWMESYVVSRLLEAQVYQCINIVEPFLFVFSALGFLFSTCGSALINSALERNDVQQASKLFTRIVIRQFKFGLFASGLLLLIVAPFIYILAPNQWMAFQAFQYIIPLILFLSFFFLSNSYQSFLVSAGKSRFSLILCIGCSFLNIILDWLFISVFHIAGAALATIFNWIFGAVIPTLWFLKHPEAPIHFLKER